MLLFVFSVKSFFVLFGLHANMLPMLVPDSQQCWREWTEPGLPAGRRKWAFSVTLWGGLLVLLVEVAIIMTSLPQGRCAEDARQGHLLHEHPWVLYLGLGLSQCP